MKKWKRNCPKCGEEITYTRKSSKVRAEKRDTNCKSCTLLGKFYSVKARKRISESKKGIKRKPFTDEHRKNISESHKGIIFSDERKKKISESKKGMKRSEETKLKIRLSVIKNIKNKCGQIQPNYNSNAISIIRTKAKEFGITDLRDAETPGGEFQVCGYFVDGYSKEKNIVIEYYEPFHKYQVERDIRRKREIINELGCKFIEIRE